MDFFESIRVQGGDDLPEESLEKREFASVDWKEVAKDITAKKRDRPTWPPNKRSMETQSCVAGASYTPGGDGGARRSFAKQMEDAAVIADLLGSNYHTLIADGARLMAEDDPNGAARVFEAAIRLDPENPTGYFNLAVAHKRVGDFAEAAAMYRLAQESLEAGSEHWAIATARVFGCLVQVACSNSEKPAWWNDADLKALADQVAACRLPLSPPPAAPAPQPTQAPTHAAAAPRRAQVVEAAPDECEAWHMRARVFCAVPGQPCGWEAGPRSSAELQQAAESYRRAGFLTPIRESAAGLAEQAEVALRLAVEQIDREIEEEAAEAERTTRRM